MSRPTREQIEAWQDLQTRSSTFLTSEDVDYLHVVLNEYWGSRDVDRFVLCLLSALDSADKLSLLHDIRHLLYEEDISRFDKVAPSVPVRARTRPRSLVATEEQLSPDRPESFMASPHDPGSRLHSSLQDYTPVHTDNARRVSTRKGSTSAALHSLTLHRSTEDGVLGLSIFGGSELNTGVFVSSVSPGSVAESSGLEVGDRLISVGGVDMRRASHASAASALKGFGPVAVVVRRSKAKGKAQGRPHSIRTSIDMTSGLRLQSSASAPNSLEPGSPELEYPDSGEAPSLQPPTLFSLTPPEHTHAVADITELLGEIVLASSDVTLICPFSGPTKGTLFITPYRLSFQPTASRVLPLYTAPACTVQMVEKIGRASSRGEYSYRLDVTCKDLRLLRFAFQPGRHSRRTVYEALYEAAYPKSLKPKRNFFAFHYKTVRGQSTAPTLREFDMVSELHRLGVPGNGWRLTSVNKAYRFCPTYPSVLAVPSQITDEQLLDVAKFRSRARIPVLSWLHPHNQTSITRSAQPLVGLRGKHHRGDEVYVQEIANANPNGQKLVVLDARPKLNAMANKARGGGYENESRYSNTEPIFLDIANIHVVRESLRKLHSICYPTVDSIHWLSELESTHWLDHIRSILTGAIRIVDFVDKQTVSVLVHCSDGWDRTSQLCGLAMLLMDPFYRTFEGFQVLVEKEWLALGHKFSQRCGHGDASAGDEQRAPIFLQFVDCVWQIMHQFPCAFEFSEQFLVSIMDHVHSCLFGTFLGNSEKERVDLHRETCSLWEYLSSFHADLRNPRYSSGNACVLHPVASAHWVQFWAAYYTRWNPYGRPLESELGAQ